MNYQNAVKIEVAVGQNTRMLTLAIEKSKEKKN